MALDQIVRGGRVVTPGGVRALDVGIEGERIAVVAEPGSLPDADARVLDAHGLLVLPGGIEPHAHIAQPVRSAWASNCWCTQGAIAGSAPGWFHSMSSCSRSPDVSMGRAAIRWSGSTSISFYWIRRLPRRLAFTGVSALCSFTLMTA